MDNTDKTDPSIGDGEPGKDPGIGPVPDTNETDPNTFKLNLDTTTLETLASDLSTQLEAGIAGIHARINDLEKRVVGAEEPHAALRKDLDAMRTNLHASGIKV